MSADADAVELLSWFKTSGGSVDESAIGLTDFSDTGRGAVAVRDIEDGERLFSIPRSLLLSTRTCQLPGILGETDWRSLGDGWAGLIVCMMWEDARGAESKWAGYLSAMPSTFSTLMFWTAEELTDLRGSAVLDKIGKEEASKEYEGKVLPLVQRRTDVFSPSHIDMYYTLERYHIMGSRILSRSFTVSPWSGPNYTAEEDLDDGLEEGPRDEEAFIGEVNVTGDDHDADVDMDKDDNDDDDDEEKEMVEDVSMAPMADMLNARYGCNNARLFYGKDDLRMVATKPIKLGEQIWNTYGDPPNSDLLRRYGYVDALDLPDGIGSPADVVEVNADLVVEAVQCGDIADRIEWWLEEGGDDAFVLDTAYNVPDDLVSLIKLLLLSIEDWTKAREKSKPPKPKLDAQIVPIIKKVLSRRLTLYPTTMEEKQSTLSSSTDLSPNQRNALIVTIAEQRILTRTLRKLEELQATGGNKSDKRKAHDHEGQQKKARVR